MNSRAGALSIRPFQVSRWRLRRTRLLWVLNPVLVPGYGVRQMWNKSESIWGGADEVEECWLKGVFHGIFDRTRGV